MKKIINLPFMVLLILLFNSCLEQKGQFPEKYAGIEAITVPDHFDYATSKEIQVTLTVPDVLKNAVFTLHTYREGKDTLCFAKAGFAGNATFRNVYHIPSYVDTIMVRSEYLGLTDMVLVPVKGKMAGVDYRNLPDQGYTAKATDLGLLKSASASVFTYMGSYNSSGVPLYLAGIDEITQSLLDDINASLPERKAIAETHPEYLANGNETNIVLAKEADVWITFVAEGASWRNALGYYTYKVGDAPKNPDEITEFTIVFPNASSPGSGGGLNSGSKVHLGKFPANTVIAFFLVANGWNGTDVDDGLGIRYSESSLNEEESDANKQHVILLHDILRSALLMGFEDTSRNPEGRSDDDFNDGIFYATTEPVDAVNTDNIPPVDSGNDADGDGIEDELDDFPYDPDKAFNNFSPSVKATGTFIFEDLWPSKGDYDFNDMVVNYNFNLIANSQNLISTIEALFEITHIGGSYRNGFGFTLPVDPSNIGNINNQVLNAGYAALAGNGTETGMNESVIFVIENGKFHTNKQIALEINFSTPVSKQQIGNAPFDPFLIINGERERELHLPDMSPTSKGMAYLGLNDDYSDPGVGRYFKTRRNLPWAINIYGSFTPPEEKVSIEIAYPRFVQWANSGGTEELDWYIP